MACVRANSFFIPLSPRDPLEARAGRATQDSSGCLTESHSSGGAPGLDAFSRQVHGPRPEPRNLSAGLLTFIFLDLAQGWQCYVI